MSKQKIMMINSQQAHELKWFCKNCTGLRQEFYSLLDQFMELKQTLDRLQKTSELIDKFFEQYPELDPDNQDAGETVKTNPEQILIREGSTK